MGRVGRDVDWIQTLLLEGTLDPTSIGRDVDWKGWKRRQLDPDVVAGRGLNPTSIGRGLEGLDLDADWKG